MAVAPAIPAVEAAPRPESPYVGLVPYGEDDAAFFFGRSTEAAIVGANLRAARLTIVYGPSGVGKSSLLMAGVVHGLREDARAADEESAFAVCVYRSWHDEPVLGLEAAARAALQELVGDGALPPSAATLAETLRAWTDRTGKLLLVLDQFEEYFQYHAAESDERGLTGFAAELARIANDPTLDVHVLLSIREDAWAKLDLFKGRIPSLFGNYLRVDHLDLGAAREAIERPIVAWNRSLPPGSEPYAIESELSEAVLEAAAGGGLTLSGGEAPAVQEPSGDRVEAPFLQLVLERLWRATVADGAHTLTLARLEALGGARRIVENHLLEALARLTEAEQDVAADCFRFLVSRSKTKIAHPAADLAEWTGRPEPQVKPVLDKLCTGESGRILRAAAPADDEGSMTYELFHDVLAEPILAWRSSHEAERNRRATRRRVIRWGSVLVALVAVFAALGIWALVQRGEARQATKAATQATESATSLALASAANEQLGTRVDESLLLSLEALRARQTVQARSSMIAALEAARRSGRSATLTGHSDVVRGVAFSPDGTTLASASDDWTLRLWDVRTHQEIGQPLRGHEGSVNSVTFSPHGTMLASVSDDKTVRLWDVRTRQQIGRPFRGHTKRVWGVAFSPDGTMLASGGADKTVRLWDVHTHRQLGQPLRGHTAAVDGVAFSPDGTIVASASDDGTLRLWDVRTHKQIGRPFRGNTDSVWGLAFSPDGTKLASAGADKTVRLWDVRTHKQLGQPLRGHTGSVENVAFSPDGTMLASASDDKTIRLWIVGTHKQLGKPHRGHTGPVDGVAFSPDGSLLASASDDMTVRLWDLRPRTPLGFPLRGHTDTVEGVAFNPRGTVLASSSDDGTVRLWNVATSKPIGTLQDSNAADGRVAFSPDGTMLASTPGDLVRLWNVSTRKPIGKPLAGHTGGVEDVAFSPDGTRLASAADDGTVRLWNVRTREPIGKPLVAQGGGTAFAVEFSPDGTTLATAHKDGTVRLWDVQTHRQIGQLSSGRTGSVYDVVFSPDGTMLASANDDTTVRLWSIRTQRQIGQPLRGHTDQVDSVVFSPDGSMLASGSTDDTVRLWDVQTHRELGQPLVGHTSSVFGVAFSPDGTRLASGGEDHVVRLWDGILWRGFADLKRKVCSLASGNLTRADWEDVAPGIAYHATCPG